MELKELQEQLQEAVVMMRKNADHYNDQEKKFGSVESLVKEQDAKWQKQINEIEESIKSELARVEAKSKRPGLDHDAKEDEVKTAHRKAFESYVRKGRDTDLQELEQKALSVNSDPDGGYFVTAEMDSEIVKKLFDTSPVRQAARTVTISTDALEGIADNDEVSTGWVGETAARPATDTPTVDKWRIPVHEQYALAEATQKLLDDSSVNIESWLNESIADKLTRTENTAFVTGNGVAKPRGFTTYADGTSWGQVEQIPTGGATAVTADGLITVFYALQGSYRASSSWAMNRTTVSAIRKLKGSDNNYLWQPGLMASEPATLLGRPILEFEDMADVAASSLSIAIADWRRAYTIVDRAGIRILRDPYSNKPYVQFYVTKRVGGGVVNFDAIKLQDTAAS